MRYSFLVNREFLLSLRFDPFEVLIVMQVKYRMMKPQQEMLACNVQNVYEYIPNPKYNASNIVTMKIHDLVSRCTNSTFNGNCGLISPEPFTTGDCSGPMFQ
jgi:hypothetical protein